MQLTVCVDDVIQARVHVQIASLMPRQLATSHVDRKLSTTEESDD